MQSARAEKMVLPGSDNVIYNGTGYDRLYDSQYGDDRDRGQDRRTSYGYVS